MFRGVYVSAGTELTLTHWVRAALLLLPNDAVASHLTAARLRGFEPRGRDQLEFSTNQTTVTGLPGVILHRRRGELTPYDVDGILTTGTDRTFVDCATALGLVQLVQMAEYFIHLGLTTREELAQYCHDRHLDGVRRARRAMTFVMDGVESPMETLVRLMLVFARLPCPTPNQWIVDSRGHQLARVDLLYERYKLIVEYDGWHHERDGRQRQRDRERREVLESMGYRLIVVTNEDLRTPQSIPWRVYAALRDRGYSGARPMSSVVWDRWFTRM